jgi:hypothetical protein
MNNLHELLMLMMAFQSNKKYVVRSHRCVYKKIDKLVFAVLTRSHLEQALRNDYKVWKVINDILDIGIMKEFEKKMMKKNMTKGI